MCRRRGLASLAAPPTHHGDYGLLVPALTSFAWAPGDHNGFSLPCPPSPAFEGRRGGQFRWWILTITEYPGEPCSAGGTSENQPPPSNGLHLLVAVGYWEELDL